MSASLVGSEMCIRDRWTPALQAASSGLMLRLPASCALSPGWLPTPRAVSYTHLTLPTICSV
eukprot:13613003-Alexandrium_andersonii.AAC.1